MNAGTGGMNFSIPNHPFPNPQQHSHSPVPHPISTVPHYVTTCYPFVQEPYFYFPAQHFPHQRARRPRRVRRVPHKVDKSLQCNIQQTNQHPSDLPNQADPDTDSGYCSPQQRAQKSSTESGLAKATSPQSPTPPGAPPNLSPSGVPQNSSPKPPSYSQVVKDSSASTPQQPPNPLSCGSGSLTPGLEIGEECVNRSLQPHRKAKKAERAQKKADLEYAGILEEENRLIRRFNATSLCSHLMDPNSFKKKGKIRETAKTKKPTPLKRVILKEREEKKQARENTDETKHEQTDEVPPLPPVLDGIATPGDLALQSTVEQSRIHSRRFREYCDQVIDKQVDEVANHILAELNRFYNRQVQKNPTKAKSKRRFVLGIREVFKHLKLGKIKCVIVSPNLEKIQSKGGLDDILAQLLAFCDEKKLPVVFALGRRALGRACGKYVPVSIVGIFDYSGCEEAFHKMMVMVEDARQRYQKLVGAVARDIESEKERAIKEKEEKIDAEITKDKLSSSQTVQTSAENTPKGREIPSSQQNGHSEHTESPKNELLFIEPELPKVPAGRKSYQQHSRNTSAASGISVCSYVSQPVSDRDWKDFVQDSEEEPIRELDIDPDETKTGSEISRNLETGSVPEVPVENGTILST